MCKTMIGIDGGGTKTEFILFTEKGDILKRLVLEGCNPNTSGIPHAVNVLKKGIGKLLEIKSETSGVFVGGSGFGSGLQGEQIEKELSSQYPNMLVRCKSDIYNIIACSSNPEQCIAVICGTGAIVYANEHGKLKRFGGGGYLVDKGGSGYHIGRDALHHALYERDCIAKKSLVTELVEQKLKTDVWSSIREVYKQDQSFIASFAPTVFEAYTKGDEVAKEILEDNAECLTSLIRHAVKHCDAGKTVIFSGSVVTKSTIFLEMIKKKLPSELQIEVLNVPQVYGACVMCCNLCGADKTELLKNFSSQYKEAIKC